MIRAIATFAALILTAPVSPETVDVKDVGPVDLRPFTCTDTPRSTIVQRICYDGAESYMLIDVRSVYYEHCRVPRAAFEAFVAAPSMGQFYNQNIKVLFKCSANDRNRGQPPVY